MVYWGVLLLEIVILFATSRFLFISLSHLGYRVVKSQKIVILLLSLLFFPGVVVHELAHALMAGLLFVRVHHIEFVPEIHEGTVKLGSVQISKTDIIRRLLIGVAPVLLGGILVGLLVWYGAQDFSISVAFSSWVTLGKYALIIFGIFVITNTMFSSKKDLEGLVGFLVIALILYGGAVFAKPSLFEYTAKLFLSERVVGSVQLASFLLVIPLGVNVVVVGVLRLLLKR